MSSFRGSFRLFWWDDGFCGHCLSPDGSNGVQVKQNAVLGCLGVGSAGSLSHLSNVSTHIKGSSTTSTIQCLCFSFCIS